MAYSKQNFQNGQILNAANLEAMENGIIAGQGAHNLLDNSDFRIAQAGYGGMYGTQKYACDRWYDTYGYGTFSFDESQGLTIAYGTNHAYLVQKINNASQYHNKTMTVALQLSDGTTYVNSGTYLSSEISFRISASNWLCDLHPDRIELVVTSGSMTIKWIALYEGAYDVNTLPAYVPKGKRVEMLNCGVPLAPHNLLDNSDFTNPVNQRGASSYNGITYTIDRWRSWDSNNITTVNDGNISVSAHIVQNIPKNRFKNGSAYTIALCASDGTIYVNSGVYTPDAEDFGDWTHTWVEITDSGDVAIYLRNGTYIWAALYEGAYTADTLPPYIPKGKHVEMLNCNVPLTPHNLLDNSNFRDPVNQRGETSKQGDWIYWIDRWIINSTSAAIELRDSGVYLPATVSANLRIVQRIPIEIIETGKAYTLAICQSDGTIGCVTGVYNSSQIGGDVIGDGGLYISMQPGQETYVYFIIDCYKNFTIRWAALYEGSYTSDTLPSYQPKGYAAELAECQRYYKVIDVYVTPWLLERTDLRRYYVGYEPMRTKPTVDVSGLKEYATWTDLVSTLNPYNIKNNRVLISATAETTSTKIYMGGSIALSADL